MSPSRFRSRRMRRCFTVAAGCLALLVAVLIGLPLAEWITRLKVRHDYRARVAAFNTSSEGFRPVYTYRAYVADPDHEIEYRLRRNTSRTVAVVPGTWRRCDSGFSYVADAWNLVEPATLKPVGYVTWEPTTAGEGWSWRTNLFVAVPGRGSEPVPATGLPMNGGGTRWHFVAGESGARVKGRTWQFVPMNRGTPAPDWMWACHTDASGFRRRSVPLSPESRRVLFIGDSVLFGYGVHGHETFVERLESRLRESSVDRAVQCVNLGVPGYNTEQEYQALRENCDRVAPSAVVLCCVSNDLEPQMTAPGRPRRLYRHATFGSWFLERTKPVLNGFLPPSLHLRSQLYRGIPEDGDAWLRQAGKTRAAREALRDIVEFCGRRKLPLLVVAIPDLEGENPHTAVLGRWCRDLKAEFLDLAGGFAGHSRESLRVSEADSHPNSLGHRLLAEALFRVVRKMLAEVDEPARQPALKAAAPSP